MTIHVPQLYMACQADIQRALALQGSDSDSDSAASSDTNSSIGVQSQGDDEGAGWVPRQIGWEFDLRKKIAYLQTRQS